MPTEHLQGYILYQHPFCPYCYKVKRALNKLDLSVEMRNTFFPSYRKELIAGGGKKMVPCLKHPNGKWQYESDDIVKFLNNYRVEKT